MSNIQDVDLVAQALNQQTVKFCSRYAELTLVMAPQSYKEVNNTVISVPGKRVIFRNGEYATNDPETIKWLREHRQCGIRFFEVKGDGRLMANMRPNRVEMVEGVRGTGR